MAEALCLRCQETPTAICRRWATGQSPPGLPKYESPLLDTIVADAIDHVERFWRRYVRAANVVFDSIDVLLAKRQRWEYNNEGYYNDGARSGLSC